MRDRIGKLPAITSAEQALREILKIATDKRTHILAQEACDWEKLKHKAIAKLARLGLKTKECSQD